MTLRSMTRKEPNHEYEGVFYDQGRMSTGNNVFPMDGMYALITVVIKGLKQDTKYKSVILGTFTRKTRLCMLHLNTVASLDRRLGHGSIN